MRHMIMDILDGVLSVLLIILLLFLGWKVAFAATTLATRAVKPVPFPGPYTAEVVRLLDADTFRARVKVWPTIETLVSVRLRGVDTPEKGWRAGCPAEAKAAARALLFVQKRIAGRKVLLKNVRLGKYSGRVIASVFYRTPAGTWRSLAGEIIRAGHGRRYGGGHRQGWCSTPAPAPAPERTRTKEGIPT